jgi:hypothetical protein
VSETEAPEAGHAWRWWLGGYLALVVFLAGALCGLVGGRLLARGVEQQNAAIMARMDMLEARFAFFVALYIEPLAPPSKH